MWRSLRLARPKSKIALKNSRFQRLYSSSSSSTSGGSGKVIFGLIATTGIGVTGAVVYGKYDPKFKALLEDKVPYISYIYKWFPDGDQKTITNPKAVSRPETKVRDPEVMGLLQKKLDREKSATSQPSKPSLESKNKEASVIKANESLVADMIKKLEKNSEDAVTAHKTAASKIKFYTSKLYEALDLPEGKDGDIIWKEANEANSEKLKALNIAKKKASETKITVEKLKANVLKLAESDVSSPLIRNGEEAITKVMQELQKAETEVISAENEAKTATDYQNLVNSSKEQFRRELQTVLPNYLHPEKDKTLTDSDLNLLIAHAHRRIEQLQKKLAKQQVSEKLKVDQAVHQQKMEDEKLVEFKVESEIGKRQMDLETAVANRVAALKDNFEIELRKQLGRQAAAHADHLQEVLKVQEQEIERKHSLEVEERLLHQKGVFISEVSGNIARLKGILNFLKAKSEFDKASKKAQAMWLACQAMKSKISEDKSGNLHPLAKDIAAIKIAADEDSSFINSVLSTIPTEAVNRGVFPNEVLKQRFENVKNVCRKVALIDENNDSMYRYFLSYVQSFLIIDTVLIPKEELEGKVAVDPSEWDTFDILSRISYCLKIDDMEQALRYANQLKGEPKVVAKDWMNEVRLLLETQLAVKALLAHAAAVGVQAYH
ncbi:MICOS complex subunit MIC60-like isoform X2 [Uloborus diversus]|uniref:MICOS complex subunit MIC60-like isoform X2 n=1 Tax=Uloborus diversus TaxID=327109 RepID=UPI00240A047C|nr:MICOS complex subunit MIC60-like isoform X2 [Uloborus diversus]